MFIKIKRSFVNIIVINLVEMKRRFVILNYIVDVRIIFFL